MQKVNVSLNYTNVNFSISNDPEVVVTADYSYEAQEKLQEQRKKYDATIKKLDSYDELDSATKAQRSKILAEVWKVARELLITIFGEEQLEIIIEVAVGKSDRSAGNILVAITPLITAVNKIAEERAISAQKELASEKYL